MQLIDIGVNLTNQRLLHDIDELLDNARSAGVMRQIITGTCPESSALAYQLTLKHPNELYATAGCHPHDAKDFQEEDLKELTKLLTAETVVAIGECGLDFNRNYSPQDIQLKVFHEQLSLAKQIHKPLFLHQRDAHQELLSALDQHEYTRAVVHCFTGTKEEAKDYLDRDLYIGITGWITEKKRGESLREAVKYIPKERLMIETDSPYLLPHNISPKPKSRTNVPAYLPFVLEMLADCLGEEPQALAEQLTSNTLEFFDLE